MNNSSKNPKPEVPLVAIVDSIPKFYQEFPGATIVSSLHVLKTNLFTIHYLSAGSSVPSETPRVQKSVRQTYSSMSNRKYMTEPEPEDYREMCLRKHRCAYDQDGERNEGYEWY
jgi:hypothetical protein